MDRNEKKSRVREIRNFLIVMSGGALCALLIAAFLVYYYSPTGRYEVDQVVLSPEVADKLTPAGNQAGVVFDGVELVYYEGKDKGWVRREASGEAYSRFYGLIKDEKSLWDVPEAVKTAFEMEKPASILVRVKEGPVLAKRIFQEVQILPNDYFRVELRPVDERSPWAYFHKDNLYDATQKVFSQE